MICLLAATPYETVLLRQQLPLAPDFRMPGRAFSCQFCDEEILLLHTGIGIASAASGLACLLTQITPELLIAFGCGGGYPASPLVNGDLALASSEEFGDLGALEERGFVPLSKLGLSSRLGEPSLFRQRIELESPWLKGAVQQLQSAAELAPVQVQVGPFVTVNTVSGTEALCLDLQERTSGICENMEGAALSQVAAERQVPLLELRGISNPCGTRNRSNWDLPAGMGIAQQAVLHLLKEFPHLRSQACD